jgi:predicted ATPase/signal transduction histidine kinase
MASSVDETLADYCLTEVLVDDGRFRLCRGRYRDEPGTLLIKVPLRQAAAADIGVLRQEYETLQALPADAFEAGITRTVGFVDGPGQAVLLLEDRLDQPLASHLPLAIDGAVDCALQLTAALAALHRAGIVHRGLNPAAVLVDAGGRVRLTDLSAAARDAAQAAVSLVPQEYATRLPYAAPEQTGRVNRGCDYRTDFYALGVLLYEMLTGSRPFVGADPLELIHAHLARLPVPPCERVAQIPLPLSQVVMKLLAKPAEERYQSAASLMRDLHRLRQALREGRVEPFAVGVDDVPVRLAVPQRLYGRDQPLALLGDAYDQARGGRTTLLLVCGHAGIGKTALIRELQGPVARSGGYFVSGKFDQLSRDVPYGALTQALRQLVQHRLTETPERLARLRERLEASLGANAAVIAEVIPQIELVLGSQRPAARLPAAEEHNRFMLAFQNFVAALSAPEAPVVVFLDDLQWVDAATLQLLAALAGSPQIRHLLLVGAYRENEVGNDHPLLETIDALQADGVPIRRIVLPPLAAAAQTQLAADAMHISVDRAAPLARVLQAKTGGNPLFLIQFLLSLQQEGLIAFDATTAQWRCRLDAIAEAALGDNVVELMSRKIDRLAPATRLMLTLAACIGNRFDVPTLAVAAGRPLEATRADLGPALAEDLIVADGDDAFVFLHDRVQQAAYARIGIEDRPRVHLKIGRLLWRSQGHAGAPDGGFDRIFDIASHLNLGAHLIESQAERLALARLNLAAGQRAKASAAFNTALACFDAGAAVLTEEHWQSERTLAFELNLEAAQCEYLCGDFDRSLARFDFLLGRAVDALQRASVHRLRLVQFENQGRFADALASAREGLRPFGVVLPEADADKQAALQAELDAIRLLLGERPIDSLIGLPTLAEPAIRMVMRILTDIWSSAYITGDATLARLISATLVRLSLAHGNAEESAYGYVTHAITAGPVHEDYEAAWEWGNLALRVNEKFDDLRLRAKIQQQFHAHVNLWRRPFRSCIAYAREACRSGLENGDFLYAAYGAATESWPAFAAAADLGQFIRDCEPNLALVLRLKNTSFADALRLMIAWARALRGETDAPLALSSADFDEDRYTASYRDNPFFSMFHAIARLHLHYLHDDYAGARRAAEAVRTTAHRLSGMIWSVHYQFWNGLTLAADLEQTAGEEREAAMDVLRGASRTLAVLAGNCAENFRCPSLLLDAEFERAAGRPLHAIELYEQAIAAAERYANVQHLALANELAGRFWLQRANRRIATLHLRSAMQQYAAWGARAKVRRLLEKHGALLAGPDVASATPLPTARGRPETLDIATIGRAAQAIGANIELEALIGQMLKLAIENAGASSGILIEDRDGALLAVAEGRADDRAAVLPRPRRLDEGQPTCCMAVVRYVCRTRQTLVVNDAAADARFAQDEYVAAVRPRSILCLPILQQGALEAIFYLDNALVADAFSSERIEVIRILASQAAMSLKSGRLVQRMEQEIAERRRAEEQLRAIEAGTAAVTGGDFFRALVRNLAGALNVRYAFVAECLAGVPGRHRRVRSRAYWSGDDYGDDFEYELPGTPCEAVLDGQTCHYASDLPARFPADTGLVDLGAQSYLGMPLLGSSGEVIGHLAIMDTRPMPQPDMALSVLRLSAGRAGAELERLKAEEGLRRALAEVEQLKNRLQDENVYLRRELIANVSHDLRSPLASLRGYLDTLLIKEKSLSAAQRRAYVQIAARQAEHLQALISELFDLARLDFDGYQIDAEPLQAAELARDVLQKFQLAAEQRRLTLQLDADGEAGFVRADIGLIERALENLIENALAYTPAGGRITLAVRAQGEAVELRVSDNGIGIPAADLPHVFERFYRVDKARTRQACGSGLGLAIVKRIVELHGSQIEVHSAEDSGTTFSFALKSARALAPISAAAAGSAEPS